MQRLHFHISINCSAERVFDVLTARETYKLWTAPFDDSSSYEGSWEVGSKICFTAINKEGKRCGMVSRIEENIPYTFLSIRHIGILEDGKEIFEGPEVDKFSGSLENYTFKEENGITNVAVELDTILEHISFFSETFPKALFKLKSICEDSKK